MLSQAFFVQPPGGQLLVTVIYVHAFIRNRCTEGNLPTYYIRCGPFVWLTMVWYAHLDRAPLMM